MLVLFQFLRLCLIFRIEIIVNFQYIDFSYSELCNAFFSVYRYFKFIQGLLAVACRKPQLRVRNIGGYFNNAFKNRAFFTENRLAVRAYNFKIRKAVACYIPEGGFYGYRRRKRGNAFGVYVNIIKAVRLSFFKRNIAAYTHRYKTGDPIPAVSTLLSAGIKPLGGKCAVALRSPCNLFNR